MFNVVGGLSPALAYWRGVAAFAANFPSPHAKLAAMHLICSMPFDLRLTVIACGPPVREQLTFCVIGYYLVH